MLITAHSLSHVSLAIAKRNSRAVELWNVLLLWPRSQEVGEGGIVYT